MIFVLKNDIFDRVEKHCDSLRDAHVFKITYNQLITMFKNIKRDMNISDHEIIEPRTMRISYAKYCIRLGVDISCLKSWMGHSDIKITEIYAEPDEKIRKEIAEKIRKEE